MQIAGINPKTKTVSMWIEESTKLHLESVLQYAPDDEKLSPTTVRRLKAVRTVLLSAHMKKNALLWAEVDVETMRALSALENVVTMNACHNMTPWQWDMVVSGDDTELTTVKERTGTIPPEHAAHVTMGVSARNLSRATMRFLAEQSGSPTDITPVHKITHDGKCMGYLMPIHQITLTSFNVPEDLKRCVRHALENHASYLRIDNLFAAVPGLPIYEDEPKPTETDAGGKAEEE